MREPGRRPVAEIAGWVLVAVPLLLARQIGRHSTDPGRTLVAMAVVLGAVWLVVPPHPAARRSLGRLGRALGVR
jgi:hypothetical protein